MIRQRLIPQFAHPRGLLGRVAGRVMATRDSNVERNRWIVDVLDPAPDARILEIGHGPGLAIERIWPRLDGGSIIGADISELMSRSASRRNREGVERGIVRFVVADSSALPDDIHDLDLVFGVNSSMFWSDPNAAVADLAGRLADGGELVLCYMTPPTSNDLPDVVVDQIAGWMRAAGLGEVTFERMDADPPAIAVRGRVTRGV